jgi:hypothetical protein
MLTRRKTVILQKLKSLDFWLVAIGWVMSLYVAGLGVLILFTGAWQGFVYFLLGATVHPKLPAPVWVRILAYVLIILIL